MFSFSFKKLPEAFLEPLKYLKIKATQVIGQINYV